MTSLADAHGSLSEIPKMSSPPEDSKDKEPHQDVEGPQLTQVMALKANLRVLYHFFVKQVITIDGKTALKKRILAVYKNGLKFITQPNKDLFEPEHIADVFEDAYLFKYVEIHRFRYDPGKSEFSMVHRTIPTDGTPPVETEFTFRTACVLDVREAITAAIEELQARAKLLAETKTPQLKTGNAPIVSHPLPMKRVQKKDLSSEIADNPDSVPV